MKVRMKCFASVKEIVGQREIVFDLPEGTSAAEVLRRLVADHPRLTGLAPSRPMLI